MTKTSTAKKFAHNPLDLLLPISISLTVLVIIAALYSRHRAKKRETALLNSPEYQRQFVAAPFLEAAPDEPLFGVRALEARQYCDDVTRPRHPDSSVASSSATSIRRGSQLSPMKTDPQAPAKPIFISSVTIPFGTVFQHRRLSSTVDETELQSVTSRDQSTDAYLYHRVDTPDSVEDGKAPAVFDLSDTESFTGNNSDLRPQTSSTTQSFVTTKSTDTNISTQSGTDSNTFQASVVTTAPTTPDQLNPEFKAMDDHRLSHVAETGTLFPPRPIPDRVKVSVSVDTSRSHQITPWENSRPAPEKAVSPPLELSSPPAMSLPSISSLAVTTSPSAQESQSGGRNYKYRKARRVRDYWDRKEPEIADEYPVPSITSFTESAHGSRLSVMRADESTAPSERRGWRYPNERFSVGNGVRLQLDEDVEDLADTPGAPSQRSRPSVFSRISRVFRQ